MTPVVDTKTVTEVHWGEARLRIQPADILLFGGWSLWPSIPIRWWKNGRPWTDPRSWVSLSPWSHAEVAAKVTIEGSPSVLCGWGSVGGGVRLMPLSRLLATYGKFHWCSCLNEEARERAILHGHDLWRSDEKEIFRGRYPTWRQYVRTAFAGLYGEKVDYDPLGFTCAEWVAAFHGLPSPAKWMPIELPQCGLFGPPVLVVL